MQSNFYGNPYGNNFYPNYQNQYQQARPNIIFSFVNGIDDAKAYILQPNQTAYLKDNNSTFLYEKRDRQIANYNHNPDQSDKGNGLAGGPGGDQK